MQNDSNPKISAQGEMLFNRLAKRYRHLKKWARRAGTDAFRVYDRDIPEIPLVLDLYGDSVSGALYKRPFDMEGEEDWLGVMRDRTAGALALRPDRVFIKERERKRYSSQYERLDKKDFIREVHEGGLAFKVNLSDYLDTGLFLDNRQTRALVRGGCAGKRVLNLFCYTASFSVYAASGGAVEVDSVDLSNTYLDWALENFSLNGFKGEKIQAREYFTQGRKARLLLIRDDVLDFIRKAEKQRLWDIVILDPPTFSNSKKMKGYFDLRRDFSELLTRCLALLAPGGKLYFCANARRFTLDAASFPGACLEDVKEMTASPDFSGRDARSCYVITT